MTSTPTRSESSPESPSLSRGQWDATTFVYGVWLLLLVAALVLAWKYAFTAPRKDEWFFIPQLTGDQPVTLNWLWLQHFEHRLPLPKLIWVALLKVTDYDFRLVTLLNVLALGILSLAMIQAAKNLRGKVAYSDAFFPLVMLHWGHGESLIWCHLFNYILGVCLAGTMLLITLSWSSGLLTRGAAVLTGVCLILCILTGAVGIPYVPAMVLWLALCAALLWRSPDARDKRSGLLVLSLVLVTVLLGGAYFLGVFNPQEEKQGEGLMSLTSLPGVSHQLGLRASLRASSQFLSQSFGPVAQSYWPYLGYGILGLSFVSVVALAAVWYQRPQDRFRALGVLFFFASVVTFALALGFGRAGYGPSFLFTPRYATLGIPFLSCIYFIWVLVSGPAGRLLQMGLFTLMCVFFPLNMTRGLEYAQYSYDRTMQMQADLLAKTPSFVLAEKPHLNSPLSKEETAAHIRMLSRAGAGLFRYVPEDPRLAEVRHPVTPVAVKQMTWEGDTGKGTGNDSYLEFALKQPRFLWGIRLKYSYEKTAAPANFKISWRSAKPGDSDKSERNLVLPLGTEPGEKTVTLWVRDTVDQFRIYPSDAPFVFKLSEMTLLFSAETSGP